LRGSPRAFRARPLAWPSPSGPRGPAEAPGQTARRRRVPRSGTRSTAEAGGGSPDNARRSGPVAVISIPDFNHRIGSPECRAVACRFAGGGRWICALTAAREFVAGSHFSVASGGLDLQILAVPTGLSFSLGGASLRTAPYGRRPGCGLSWPWTARQRVPAPAVCQARVSVRGTERDLGVAS
jgi:hypothetical protein